MALVTNIGVRIDAALSSTVGLAPVQALLAVLKSIALASGTGADAADKIYTSEASIATGATLSLDLAASLEDALGAAFTPAKLKLLLIYSRTTNTTNLTLFGDAASVPIVNTAATTMTMRPGGLLLIVAPDATAIAVTATSADIIKIVNASGATAVVDIVLIGTSA
jgi:hypothetical protein